MHRTLAILFSGILFLVAAPGYGGWEQDWEQTVKAAKEEGKVVVSSSPGTVVRDVLTQPFEKKFGIKVQHSGGSPNKLVSRVRLERAAGKYLWDVVVQGTTTAITSFKPMGVLDPVEPALILPEVKDPKHWLEGKLWFSEKDRVNLLMGLATRPGLAVNSNLVKTDQFKSYQDLLDPKWTGKMVVGRDPKIAGASQAQFLFLYLHKDLGPEYIRALFNQKITMSGSDDQALSWLGQGKMYIMIGPPETNTMDRLSRGVPIGLVPPPQMREGSYLSPGPATLMLLNRAPHPNAARVYINWILSREGQIEYARATNVPSLRVDMPPDDAPSWRKPRPGYIDGYTEEAMAGRKKMLAFLKTVPAQ